MIIIMHCSLMLYCSIMGFLIWKDSRVWHFAPAPLPCSFDHFCGAGRGCKGVSGGPAILITIKSLVPVTHIGAFIGRRLSKGACAASPAPGTPQHQTFYHLHHHHHDNDHDHHHHKANAALRAVRPCGRDRGSRIQSGGYILGCSQHCLNVVKVLEGSFWVGTSWDCLVTGTIHTPHMNNHIQKSLSFKN